MKELPVITTERLLLRLGSQEDIPMILNYYIENKIYLTPFYPPWAEDFFTYEYWQKQVEKNIYSFINDISLKLFAIAKTDKSKIIASINFSNFVRGSAQYCNLGYSVAEKEQGKGYMSEGVEAAIKYVFQELNMHRIMANYIPCNQRSGNLLKRLGFVVEGYARDYLLINGKWEDHILTSLINSSYELKSVRIY